MKVEIIYKGKKLNCDYKCDFLIENAIVLEIKSVKCFDIHRAKLLNYMSILKVSKGILINFNVKNIYHEGQETLVNEDYKKLL